MPAAVHDGVDELVPPTMGIQLTKRSEHVLAKVRELTILGDRAELRRFTTDSSRSVKLLLEFGLLWRDRGMVRIHATGLEWLREKEKE